MRVSVAYDFVAKRRSANASIVMDHFGVGFETGRHVIANGLDLPIEPGDVVCFTGESGSGKSSLLRAAAAGLSRASDIPARAPASQLSTHNSQRLIDLAAIELPDRLVIDAVGLPAGEAMRLLSAVGLGEARLMLRRPRELSDGERYRFRLALALARRPRWIVADEFTATLDRTLAKVVAYNVRRQADR
ncbi:MAG TPA: ATP-binding cassette domain-containing protein, partial [Planctomycetaceae bacterium]|nr:ATP-binding cassette domain-containing protein [Planctomycetaceae bacterium]